MGRGVAFAYRLTRSGGVRHSDFHHVVEGGVDYYLPSPVGAPPRGQSYFIVLSHDTVVLDLAHEVRGAATEGCQMFALDAVPAELALVVDSILVGTPEAPAVVHASLVPRKRMTMAAFFFAAYQWRAELVPCMLEAAGGGGSGGDTASNGDDALAAAAGAAGCL